MAGGFLIAATACGGGATAARAQGGDAGAAAPGDGGSAASSGLTGRWWGTTTFTPAFGTTGVLAPAAIDFGVDAAGDPTEDLWIAGTKLDLRTAIATGRCNPTPQVPKIAVDQGTLALQIDDSECDASSPTQVVGTFTRSTARLLQARSGPVAPLTLTPDQHLLVFASGDHPFAWDATAQALYDLAPSFDGGPIGPASVPESPPTAAVSSDGSRVAYCTSVKSPSALYAYGLTDPTMQTLAPAAICASKALSLSADGKRLAYLAAAPSGQPPLDLQVRDFTSNATVTVYTSTAGTIGSFWLGPGGRYLLYFASTNGDADAYAPLFAYDMTTQQSQSLGESRWVTPSADGRYAAFSRSDGRLLVWSDASGTAADTDSLYSQEMIAAPLSHSGAPVIVPSPDRQKFLYWDADHGVHVFTFGDATPELVVGAVSCPAPGGSAPLGASASFFSTDAAWIGTLGPAAGQCTASVHAFEVASRTDHVMPLPDGGASSVEIDAVGAAAVAYDSAADGYALHLWSVAAGDVVVNPPARITPLLAALSDDANRMIFEYDTSPIEKIPIYLWDRSGGTAVLASTLDNSMFGSSAMIDPASGVALAYDDPSATFMLARPGAPPVAWAPGNKARELSPSKKVFAITGTVGLNDAVYAVSFPSGAAQTFNEVGDLVTVTDSSVYFVGPDGLCLAPVP